MRFRRRPEPAPDEGGDERSEWVPPEGDEQLSDRPEFIEPDLAGESPGPSGAAAEPEVLEPEVLEPEPEVLEPEVLEPEVPESEPAPVPTARAKPVARRDWPPETAVVTDANGAVRAAGGLIWSNWGHRGLHVVLVHRRKYDDWSLPKGKAEWGESDPACALREVREETGLICALGEELEPASYVDRKGRPKTVRYWVMQPIAGSFTPNDEVDEIRWVPAAEAVRILTYPRDAAMVAEFAARETPARE